MANFKKLNLFRSKVGEDLLAGKDLIGAEPVRASPSRGDRRPLQEHTPVEERVSGRPKKRVSQVAGSAPRSSPLLAHVWGRQLSCSVLGPVSSAPSLSAGSGPGARPHSRAPLTSGAILNKSLYFSEPRCTYLPAPRVKKFKGERV